MHRFRSLPAFPVYPVLIGLYAVVFLWSVNVGQIVPATASRTLTGAAVFGLLVFLVCFAVWHNLRKSAMFSGWLLAVFFSYGHLYKVLEHVSIAGWAVGRHRVLLAAFAALTLLILVLLIRARRDLRRATVLLNITTLAMLLLAAIPVISYEARYGSQMYRSNKDRPAAQIVPADHLPDVYYIIVDGYSSADVLDSAFQYNNADFITGLETLGFYVPTCAYSNYTKTTPSLSSSLNMEYVENLGVREEVLLDPFDPSLAPFVVQSKVRRTFEGMGYSIAAFYGYMPALDLLDADYYFSAGVADKQFNQTAAMKFEHLFLGTTLLEPLVESFESGPQAIEYYLPDALTDILYARTSYGPYQPSALQWRKESEYLLDVLPTIPQLPGKKFVYAHLYSTHIPFVFTADGGFPSQDVYLDERMGYIPTVEYTNKRLLPILADLIARSPVKPIIILQADHGATTVSGADHNQILSAYYFPDQDYARLYDTITPVNTFRVVLSQFFQQDHPLLPDTVLIADGEPGQETLRRLPAGCGLK